MGIARYRFKKFRENGQNINENCENPFTIKVPLFGVANRLFQKKIQNNSKHIQNVFTPHKDMDHHSKQTKNAKYQKSFSGVFQLFSGNLRIHLLKSLNLRSIPEKALKSASI